MRKLILLLSIMLLLSFAVIAQTGNSQAQAETIKSQTEPKRKNFRANKEQITQAQKMLNVAETGKMNADTKTAVKTFQEANGLRKSGSLNRATLEKMNIALTDAQKEIPVSANSYAIKKVSSESGEPTKRVPVFRATKEQVNEAQRTLKSGGMYAGEETGKLDDATRESLKKYQEANQLNVTGTLNQATLEKMNIALTDRQKGIETPKTSGEKSSDNSADSAADKPKRGPVFRANKEQITEVQKKLKAGAMYNGEESGKLDDATREGIKKWQEANGVKVTGTLNKETLEKMGIALTDKQKEM